MFVCLWHDNSAFSFYGRTGLCIFYGRTGLRVVVAERHTPVIDCVVTTDTLSFLYLVAGPAGGGKTHASHKLYIYNWAQTSLPWSNGFFAGSLMEFPWFFDLPSLQNSKPKGIIHSESFQRKRFFDLSQIFKNSEHEVLWFCHKFSKTQNLRFFDLSQTFKNPKPKVLSFAKEKLKNPKPEVTIKIKEPAQKQG